MLPPPVLLHISCSTAVLSLGNTLRSTQLITETKGTGPMEQHPPGLHQMLHSRDVDGSTIPTSLFCPSLPGEMGSQARASLGMCRVCSDWFALNRNLCSRESGVYWRQGTGLPFLPVGCSTWGQPGRDTRRCSLGGSGCGRARSAPSPPSLPPSAWGPSALDLGANLCCSGSSLFPFCLSPGAARPLLPPHLPPHPQRWSPWAPPGSACWGAAEGSSGAALAPAPIQAPLRCQDLYWRPPPCPPPGNEGRLRAPISPSPALRLPRLRFPSAPLVPGVPLSGLPLHPMAMGQGHFAPLPLKPGPAECGITWCLAGEVRSFRHPLPMPQTWGLEAFPSPKAQIEGCRRAPILLPDREGAGPAPGAAASGCLGKAGSPQPAPCFQLPSVPRQEANPHRLDATGGEGRAGAAPLCPIPRG
ncbi:basic proline-rich protein-like [Lathamus discolor]|uniref:basic proline-rich protein-like n=1 Tax=Lathamus discolor TaxID=678569 RepID=UPI0032B7D370